MFPLGFDASAQGEIFVCVSPPAGVLRCSVPGKGSLTHGASHCKLTKVHYQITVVDRFSRHRFSRNPDLVENFAVTNHFYSIKIQYSRKFDLVD